ncbi:MAG TPA: carboxypeptidase-like regulatory domain-containing protein [Pyrinomonadaceae bacterium]|nr:carboxypeptidase-like regulatory domain-containing protein [Pyrinomonadaceae bacterium]
MKVSKYMLVILIGTMFVGSVLAQDKTTGGLKGKVRVETGTPAGVTVVIRNGDVEVARGLTGKNGEFEVRGLKPGRYGITLRKAGLSVGTKENIDVQAGKSRSLGDHLFLAIDEGSIAFIRGSVFSEDGRSMPNVKIELARVEADGNIKKLDGRVTNETGSFSFRLAPENGKYRITAKASGGEPVSKDVDVDGAAVYRVALSVKSTK